MALLTRTSVKRRETFLEAVYSKIRFKQFWQCSLEDWNRGQRALDLLLQIQGRYPHEQIEVHKPNLTWENITQNGKYALD